MAYIDGFVIAVPTASQPQFIAHANRIDSLFIEHGATRVVECWGADVPKGKTTDFQGAVLASDDETVALAWVEWPDKATRDAGMGRINALAQTDERCDRVKNPLPFDGQRMIFGGFEAIVEQGAASTDSYVQGFVIPVPTARREAYRQLAQDVWPIFQDHGALRVVEAWGDEVPDGKLTDFRRAVKAESDETIVFSWIEWPSRETCDASHDKMMQDARMQRFEGMTMPFDPQRMIFGGFSRVVTLET